MKARLIGFRGSRRDVINNYGILEVREGNIASLVGKRVSWSSDGGKLISGVILRTHGKRALLARFKKGLPGSALGGMIAIGPIPAPLKKARKAKKPAKVAKKPAKPVKKAEKKAKKPVKTEKKKPPVKKKEPVKKAAKKAIAKKAPVKKKPAAKKAPTKEKTKAKPKKTGKKVPKKKAPKKKA